MTTKLLAVDDSKTMRKVLEITFAGDNYDSTVVGSADEALGAVRAGAPQVAVVDGHLGSSSGYNLCRQIKEIAPHVKVMLLSSKQRPYDEGAGSSAGVDDHFDKPFDSTKFLAKVDELAQAAGEPAAAPAPVAAPPPAAAPSPAAPPAAAPAPASRAAAPPAAAPRPSAAQRPQAPPPRVPEVKPEAKAPARSPPSAARPAPAPVTAAAAAATGNMEGKLQDMGLTKEQVQSVLSLSRDVVEQVVWEVVPELAETLIKEEIARLTSD